MNRCHRKALFLKRTVGLFSNRCWTNEPILWKDCLQEPKIVYWLFSPDNSVLKRGTSPGRLTSTSTRRRRTSPPLTATRSISRKSCDELRERQHLYVESSGRRRSRGIAKDFQTVAKRPARFQEDLISYRQRRDISQTEQYSPPENPSGAVWRS